jgi:heme O synthase-like polyprenyltransferase
MAIASLPPSRRQLLAQSPLTMRLSAFLALLKPRVMLLAVFTAVVGLVIAPGHPDALLGSIAVLAIAAGAGAAGVLNMWSDIDAVMTRSLVALAMSPSAKRGVAQAQRKRNHSQQLPSPPFPGPRIG